MAKEWHVKCKKCGTPISYSGMMFEKMDEAGQSRPEYCDDCRKILLLEKMTMGAAYFSAETLPGTDLTIAIPGELGMVYHDARPHIEVDTPATFDQTKFGATPDKIVELYEWLKDKRHQVAIIVGPTGSGKSTALPYWLIFPPEGIPDDFFIRNGQICITQPRIVATTSIAEYLGVLLGSGVGKGFDIGYRYSKDRNADRYNAAFLATDGTLINMIKNGQLNDLGVIVIDEAHERSLNIDIILRLLRDQLPLYPHLKLLIVSATINKDLFLNFFGEDTAKVVEFEAKRKFDYQVFFAQESEKLPYEEPAQLRSVLVSALTKKVMWLLEEQATGRKTPGHTLAFLHGVKPIEEAVAILRREVERKPELKDMVEIFPLYSDLSPKESELALKGGDGRKIRVVVCTNVAEASVTVEGTVYVVETGVENQANWDIETTQKRVGLNLISQANAKQRWGRSGRTAPGEVFCLYTEEQFGAMIPFPIPAIQRSSMDEIILLLKDMGVDDLADGWIEAPIETELARSYTCLQGNGAIDEDGMLTEYGALLREFQYTASITDLIILSDSFGCAVEIATILPVIRTGGFKYLLRWDKEWDRKTQSRAKQAHEYLMSNCRDDVEFILKLYSIWQDPPALDGKKHNLKERREAWASEYFVNFELFGEDIETEKDSILSLLTKRRKDRNIRPIDLSLINRVRVILAYCLPYNRVGEIYQYNTRLESPSPDVAYQLALPAEQQKRIEEIRSNHETLASLARTLAFWEKMWTEDVAERLLKDIDLPLDEIVKDNEAVWMQMVSESIQLGMVVEGTARAVVSQGIFVDLVEGLTGFVHISSINPYRFIRDVAKVAHVGMTIRAKVVDFDPGREQIKLAALPPEEGMVIEGVVTRIADYGAFVELGLGYSGLLHKKNMGRGYVRNVTDVVEVGDKIEVEVLEVYEDGGRLKIGLGLL